jgi:glycosyltransferase involved in cell wall biosynthesis
MQILAVTWGFPRRDQPFLVTRFRLLAERGHRVRVLCAPGDPYLVRDLETPGGDRVEIRPLLSEKHRTPRQLVQLLHSAATDRRFALEAARTLYRRGGWSCVRNRLLDAVLPFAGERPDVVHFEFANWAASFTEVLPLLACPKVITCHGSDIAVEPLVDLGLRRRLAIVFDHVDRIVCVSENLATRAVDLGADPDKVVVIPMGVNTEAFSWPREPPGTRGDLRMVSVGRLHWVKGYEYALQAVDLLSRRGHVVNYTIAGDDGGGEKSVRLARRDLALEERVTLAGFVPPAGVRDLLRSADLFVLPSISEGVSTAALEAMAMGVPVVVTDVGGMADVIDYGRAGMLVPPRDSLELANAIERLIVDPDLREGISKEGTKRVRECFDAGQQTDRLVAMYEDLVTSGP